MAARGQEAESGPIKSRSRLGQHLISNSDDGDGSRDDDGNDDDSRNDDGGDNSDDDSGDGDGNIQQLPSACRPRRRSVRSRLAERSLHSEWDPTTRQMIGRVGARWRRRPRAQRTPESRRGARAPRRR